MSTKNLLVELFVEELPPKALKALGESFAATLTSKLRADELLEETSRTTTYASPRRLAAHITDVRDVAPKKMMQKKLMPAALAFDAQGQRSDALRKRLMKEGYDKFIDGPSARLVRRKDGANEFVDLAYEEGGYSIDFHLDFALKTALAELPIPKVMSYQLTDGWTSVNFVRPAHGLVALHGAEVVNVSVLGLDAGRTTRGHRFEASKPVIELTDADSYAQQLESEGAVIASFSARRAEIVRQLQAAANKEGLQPITDEALLDEVTALVERPNVLTCQFEMEFLEVPAECLILTMKANQKYFPLLEANGKLTNKFLVVSNITPSDPSRVIDGNERVVRPRLADAKFFYDQDRKQTLASRVERLKKIVYHNGIRVGDDGRACSLFDRTLLVQSLARTISNYVIFYEDGLPEKAQRAAQLAKADLVTEMVGEFPELQGIMGRYYAEHDGEDKEVAQAIFEQYLPRGAGDSLPTTKTGIALALSDKIVTLALIFEIGEKPSGSKDPFGLRRAAIGVLRILIECRVPLDLRQMISDVALGHSELLSSGLPDEVYDYIAERLRGYYLESNDLQITTEMFDAVLANRPASLLDFDQRLRALASFLKLNDAQSLAAANKRINNILKKVAGSISKEVDTGKFSELAEGELFAQLQAAEADTTPLFASRNYADALTRLATLRPAVDQFFDTVMVMADDIAVRNNRLALLARLRGVFLQVADLSRLPG